MNYYPTNFYSSYPYNQPQPQPQPQQTYQPMMQSNLSQSQSLGLQGKIVDSADMVRVTDVPVGGYGIFPRADLNEIYVKTWNGNGTTSIVTYKPIVKDVPKEDETNIGNVQYDDSKLIEKIEQLEIKLDNFISSSINQQNTNTKALVPNNKGKEF